jgi:Raf kinase inhibitor-like YbhB/YbcL family protein
MRTFVLGSLLATAAFCNPALAQQGDGTETRFETSIFKPAKIPASDDLIAALKAPDGFKASVFAKDLKNARIMAVAPDGTVYLSRRDQGDVLMLRDTDGDGMADGVPVTVANRSNAHGLAVHDGKLYLVTVKELFVTDIKTDGTLGPLEMLIGDLPDSGQHPNRTLAFGPDGMIYLSVGSTCNACNESNPENATILRLSPDGKTRTIFASGLRNTIGFDWDPATGELWGFDHGIDYIGDDAQPEELNKIEAGKKYGWPHVFGDGGIYPQSTPPGDMTKDEWKAQSVPMVLGYTAHSAPMQMVFASGGKFPAEYDGDAFATMRGSWNRKDASGYEIVRIDFEDGKPKTIEPFVTGFLTDGGKTHIARPVGLAFAKDGSLLMSDDANGVIYRVAYTGDKAAAKAEAAPATVMEQAAAKGFDVPLANARPETKAERTLEVASTTIKPDVAIPEKHSDYADGVSPNLSWTKVEGAQSYAIVMEDPDAKPKQPFVHWLAWNIPAETTTLPEGLQEQLRLTEPDGVLQGANSRGSVGYYGPHPAVGDPAHRYHIQVLALDMMLSVPAGADRDTVLAAVEGHVLAKGELVGSYAQTVQPPK